VPGGDDQLSDTELVQAVCRGDRAAYAVLVDRHLGCVLSVAARIVGNRADAEDVAQDAFVRAFQRLDRYDMAHPFRNWLLKIASNGALNHLRSKRRERARNLRLAEQRAEAADEPAEVPDMPGPGDWGHWLAQLQESQRAAIVLFHFHELSYAQVAEVLGVPINTVKTFLHRGRRRLRELMSARGLPESGLWTAAI
jgi:RNA polymerase sigma-70 factor, ECF subfamily